MSYVHTDQVRNQTLDRFLEGRHRKRGQRDLSEYVHFQLLYLLNEKKIQKALCTTKRGRTGQQAHTSQINLSLGPDMFTTSCGLLSISKLTNSNLGDKDSFHPRKHLKPSPPREKQIRHLSVLQGVLFYMCVSYVCSSSPLINLSAASC